MWSDRRATVAPDMFYKPVPGREAHRRTTVSARLIPSCNEYIDLKEGVLSRDGHGQPPREQRRPPGVLQELERHSQFPAAPPSSPAVDGDLEEAGQVPLGVGPGPGSYSLKDRGAMSFLGGVAAGTMGARLESPRRTYATPGPRTGTTRAPRRRQLPTNHGHAALPRVTRVYQLDSSSKPPHRDRRRRPQESLHPGREPDP